MALLGRNPVAMFSGPAGNVLCASPVCPEFLNNKSVAK